MRLLVQSCSMAVRDYLHESLLSACAALGLAAVLTPLLVLYGVKFGIVTTMTERMLNDPKNLEISPVSSG
ncbi:MAG: ABC transporter permease, partial [Deltaproteobacteria bacterium]|nr:ABC transporter permease [Deltaproteobacteria bacterium]